MRYYHHDHLGNPLVVLDEFQQADAKHKYSPFGVELPPIVSTAEEGPYRFTGYERDSESRLDYMFKRYYSQHLARFLSTDPVGGSVGSSQSWNKYVYCLNNPIKYIDPDGMDVINATDHTIYFKPGEGLNTRNALPIAAGREMVASQDGIADPVNHPGEVFKVVTGINLLYNSDGTVEYYGAMPGHGVGLKLRAGQFARTGGKWLGTDFLLERWEKGDHDWDELFGKAGVEIIVTVDENGNTQYSLGGTTASNQSSQENRINSVNDYESATDRGNYMWDVLVDGTIYH